MTFCFSFNSVRHASISFVGGARNVTGLHSAQNSESFNLECRKRRISRDWKKVLKNILRLSHREPVIPCPHRADESAHLYARHELGQREGNGLALGYGYHRGVLKRILFEGRGSSQCFFFHVQKGGKLEFS